MHVEKALELLAYSPKKSAALVKKVLESAIANAEHNEGADIDELRVSKVFVDEGPTMKRIKPRAKGRADRIFKRSAFLAYSPKKSAALVKKVLESAIANAEHNEGADIDELRVSKVFVDEGPTMKRIKPRAKGRADRIFKRSSHITVVVADN